MDMAGFFIRRTNPACFSQTGMAYMQICAEAVGTSQDMQYGTPFRMRYRLYFMRCRQCSADVPQVGPTIIQASLTAWPTNLVRWWD
eukprot:1157037-Pelagomonas_calceolata.AAC.1